MPREACERIEAELTAFHQGELSPERHAEVAAHAEGCADCARAVEETRAVFSAAAEVEDLVPSMRFRRNLAALVAGARPEPRKRSPGSVVDFFLDRLRSSRKFRFATAAVVVHAAAVVVLSFLVLPRLEETPRGEFRAQWDGSRPVLGDEPAAPDLTERPGASLPPDPGSPFRDVEPDPFAAGPGDHPATPRELYLPPSEPLYRPLNGLFASSIGPETKERRLAACFADPKAAAAAIRGGLAHLAAAQGEDGSFRPSSQGEEYRTGATAAVVLAFLSDGHSETRGVDAYRRTVRRAVDYLLAAQHREGPQSGLIGPARGHFTYNHALATLALVEVHVLDDRRIARDRSKQIVAAVRAALDYFGRRQADSGGFPYAPGGDAPDAGQTDSSTGSFVGLALSAARDAGHPLPAGMLEKLAGWLRELTDERGRIGYRFRGDRAEDALTRTAGVLYLEELLGVSGSLRDRRAAEVAEGVRDPNRTKRDGLFRLYAALSFRLRGEMVLDRFSAELFAGQREDGSWSAEDDRFASFGGDAFLTAINVLTLTSAYHFAG